MKEQIRCSKTLNGDYYCYIPYMQDFVAFGSTKEKAYNKIEMMIENLKRKLEVV